MIFNLNFRQNKPINFSSSNTINENVNENKRNKNVRDFDTDSKILYVCLCVCVMRAIICVHHFYRKLTECFGHFVK